MNWEWLTKFFSRDPEGELAVKFLAPAGFCGQITMWPTNTAPAGWLLLDGSQVEKRKYPDLWNLLGTTYGSATTTLFTLPDMRGRVPVGRDASQTEFDVLNDAGGAKTHTLSTAEIPAHKHLNTIAQIAVNFGSQVGVYSPGSSHPFFTNNAGSGGAHNNLQPYRTLNFIIKT